VLDTIYIGTSGLTSYSEGLRTVSNNLTNVNTPGYKGTQLQFADVFSQQSGLGSGGSNGASASGNGLQTLATSINFKQGDFQQTSNALDAAIDGLGFFVLHDNNNGQIRYTRDGQFQFDANGYLTSRVDGARVQALTDKNQLADITLSSIQSNAPKATGTVTLTGNLASDGTTFTLNGVTVIDAVGGQHTLTLTFTNASGVWTVSVADGSTTVGTGTIQFSSGAIVSGKDSVSVTYSPAGVPSIPLKFDFSSGVTSFANSGTSTLSVSKQDGHVAGTLTNVTFNDEGFLSTTYSNGQTDKSIRLALASVDSEVNIAQAGANEFLSNNPTAVHYGYAKTKSFGSIKASVVEGSNVDMAQEFSNLIVMQRGYQASSHVVSTANDMIQELFDMKGHR
jgi:flagellar hook protein FlgE